MWRWVTQLTCLLIQKRSRQANQLIIWVFHTPECKGWLKTNDSTNKTNLLLFTIMSCNILIQTQTILTRTLTINHVINKADIKDVFALWVFITDPTRPNSLIGPEGVSLSLFFLTSAHSLFTMLAGEILFIALKYRLSWFVLSSCCNFFGWIPLVLYWLWTKFCLCDEKNRKD